MNWLYWRPVVGELGTLTEVKHRWTIDDLMDAHEVLDLKAEAEAEAMRNSRR